MLYTGSLSETLHKLSVKYSSQRQISKAKVKPKAMAWTFEANDKDNVKEICHRGSIGLASRTKSL